MATNCKLLVGDCRETLKTLPAESIHCCVTSPPYWGLRDYGHGDQLGLEKTPEEYVEKMVAVFREVRRVLRNDGTLWLNLGDSYNARPGQRKTTDIAGDKQVTMRGSTNTPSRCVLELKPKDLVGIPWRVAFALQSDGWHLRQDIIWHKPNPKPESVLDRCTKAHEYLFLLSKSRRYYFDSVALSEEATGQKPGNKHATKAGREYEAGNEHFRTSKKLHEIGARTRRNRRSVWTVATKPYKGAHFATFPPRLIEPCIHAGTSEKGCCAACGAPFVRVVKKDSETPCVIRWKPSCKCQDIRLSRPLVLDPFNGSGTTGEVARLCGCDYIGCELNPKYAELSYQRWDRLKLL